MNPKIEYLPDDNVTDTLDHELRGLLKTCFTKPQDVVFKYRRFFREPYPHRWVIRNENNAIIAHIGVHEKQVETECSMYRIGGISEVCVHPNYRGKGYVRMMLKCIHAWLSEHGFAFAVLFGDRLVYRSSGYVQVTNLFLGGSQEGWKQINRMIRDLCETPWPSGCAIRKGLIN